MVMAKSRQLVTVNPFYQCIPEAHGFLKAIPERQSPLREPESSGLRLFSCITSFSMPSFLLLCRLFLKMACSVFFCKGALLLLHQEVELISPPFESEVAVTCFDPQTLAEVMLCDFQAEVLRSLAICIFTFLKALSCRGKEVRAIGLERQIEAS